MSATVFVLGGGDVGLRIAEGLLCHGGVRRLIVADADAHYLRAKQAGADIVIEIADQDHGGRLYSCRDPEGHLWNFGSYDPWEDSE